MKASEHFLSPEELMAYLDGEVAPDRAEIIREHLSACDVCGQVAADLRDVSASLARWPIQDPPAGLQAPAPKPLSVGWWPLPGRPRAVVWQASAVAGALLVAVTMSQFFALQHQRPPEVLVGEATRTIASAPAVAMPEGVAASKRQERSGQAGGTTAGPIESKGPLIARTAALSIVVTDFDAVRPALDRMLREAGGFIARINTSGSRGTPRALSASLRVPSAQLEAAVAGLRGLGRVTSQSEAGDDVTEQVRDLDVRLANARSTEKRLVDVLEHRTGKVSDILEAEREIARVRGEIEQMDAQRKNLDQRVTYATVSLTVEEERKAELDLGPLTPSARLRNALVDGVRGAFDSAFGALLFLFAAGPTLLLWTMVLAWPARMIWRRWRLST